MPVLLIAGGSRGIGAATARLAAQRGYDVAVNYKSNAKAAESVAAAVKAAGRKAATIAGDMAKEADIERVFDAAARELGPITHFVHSAGITGDYSRLDDASTETMREVLDVNALWRAALPARRNAPHVEQARRQRRLRGDAVVDGGDIGRRQ